MEQYHMALPNDSQIIQKESFIVDQILPLKISKVAEDKFIILFCITQDSTEECKYIQLLLNVNNDEESNFLQSLPLSTLNSPARVEFFNSMVSQMTRNNSYNTDLSMTLCEDHKNYFKAYGAAPREDNKATLLELLITRDNYIKINLFINRLIMRDPGAELIFANHKLNNIEFLEIKKLKHDASATYAGGNIVLNHYTCAAGPMDSFKFNYITKKIPNRTLRNPMLPEIYDNFYTDDFTITDIIYDESIDCVFVIYEQRSDITNRYKKTVALKFTKEFYDRTNFIDPTKIYEDIKEDNKKDGEE